VKLEKNATDTCAMLSEAYGGEAMKKSSVFELHKQFKESSHVKITNEDNAHHFLKQLHEAVYREEPELSPTAFSTMTMLQLTRCSLSSSFWSKNLLLKWNTHPVLLIWL
jgi:hypothetical protein